MYQLLTREECQQVIDFAEGVNEWVRVEDNKNGISSKYWRYTINYSFPLLSSRIKSYMESELNIKLDSPGILILKYAAGDRFDRHYDRISYSDFNKDFVFNVNMMLNDDFEGGEFYLKDKPITENRPGVIYYYKSSEFHEVKPITSGVRYSCLFYLRERDIIKTALI